MINVNGGGLPNGPYAKPEAAIIDGQNEPLDQKSARILAAKAIRGIGMRIDESTAETTPEVLLKWELVGINITMMVVKQIEPKAAIALLRESHPITFAGRPLELRIDMPPNEIWFKDVFGEIVGKIINIGEVAHG